MAKKKIKSTARTNRPKSKSKKKKRIYGSNKFRTVQSILSAYAKENGIKLGKSFNTVAGQLYQKTKGHPVKFISQNIDQLYKQFTEPVVEIPREFPDGFPFYQFLEKIEEPIFDNVKISIQMADGMIDDPDFAAEGDRNTVGEYYRENVHRYLRVHYNESPPAIFKILATDNTTFVDYEIQPGIGEVAPPAEKTEEKKEETKKETAPAAEELKAKELEKQILEKQIELEREKQKTAQMSIEKAKQALELAKAGFSKDEILKLMGI